VSQKTILIFQPYVDEIGHFKDFHTIWRTYLIGEGVRVLSVLGTTTVTREQDVWTFPNQSKNRLIQILGTIKGLQIARAKAVHHHAAAIYVQDFEILTFSIAWLLYFRSHRAINVVLHQHSGNFQPDASASFFIRSYRWLTRFLYNWLLSYPNITIVANGKFIADALIAYTKTPHTSRVIASNWGTTLAAEPHRDTKIPNSFLFAGIIRSDKNIEYLLQEFARVADQNFTLTIAGKPFDYTVEHIQQLIDASGIPPENITFIPGYFSYDDWRHIFGRAEFIVIPYKSTNQSSSGPLIDALQFGCIPIVSDFGERGFITKAYEFGMTFNFTDTQLSDCLRDILKPSFDRTPFLKSIEEKKHTFTWNFILDDLTKKRTIFRI
jgi:glycosyltransferase involved in cell wall biosynthesis